MDKPLPEIPSFDLTENRNALSLPDKKKPIGTEKKPPDLPAFHQTTFVGAFDPEPLTMNAVTNGDRRALAPRWPIVDQKARPTVSPAANVPPSKFDVLIPMPAPQDTTISTLAPSFDQSTFIGGFDPGLLVVNAALEELRQPLAPLLLTINQNRAPPKVKVSSSDQMVNRPSLPLAGEQPPTMQYPFDSPELDTPTTSAHAPPAVTVPPRQRSDSTLLSEAAATPPTMSESSAVCPADSEPTLNVTPSRPLVESFQAPPCPQAQISFPGKNTVQCSGIVKAGPRRCLNKVRLPATHSLLDPIPETYCYHHKKTKTVFYADNPTGLDSERFIKFGHHISKYLRMDTQLALKREMAKEPSISDVPGYIYAFEIRDPKRPDVTQLKVGRAVNVIKRLDEWDKQCDPKVEKILRGWWPGTVERGGKKGKSLLEGNIKESDPGPYCHRVERLVHIELSDLSLYEPYQHPDWPNSAPEQPSGAVSLPGRRTTNETYCLACGVVHQENFIFRRPKEGRYNGKERDSIVKPVIEKWGRFVKECYPLPGQTTDQ